MVNPYALPSEEEIPKQEEAISLQPGTYDLSYEGEWDKSETPSSCTIQDLRTIPLELRRPFSIDNGHRLPIPRTFIHQAKESHRNIFRYIKIRDGELHFLYTSEPDREADDTIAVNPSDMARLIVHLPQEQQLNLFKEEGATSSVKTKKRRGIWNILWGSK